MQSAPTVLVVDADEGARASVVGFLREFGYEVVEAHDGAGAAAVAADQPPDLLIVDPWPFVAAAGQLVRRLAATADPPEILVVTGAWGARSRLDPWMDGSARWLEKPCGPFVLLSAIESMVGGAAAGAAGAEAASEPFT